MSATWSREKEVGSYANVIGDEIDGELCCCGDSISGIGQLGKPNCGLESSISKQRANSTMPAV